VVIGSGGGMHEISVGSEVVGDGRRGGWTGRRRSNDCDTLGAFRLIVDLDGAQKLTN